MIIKKHCILIVLFILCRTSFAVEDESLINPDILELIEIIEDNDIAKSINELKEKGVNLNLSIRCKDNGELLPYLINTYYDVRKKKTNNRTLKITLRISIDDVYKSGILFIKAKEEYGNNLIYLKPFISKEINKFNSYFENGINLKNSSEEIKIRILNILNSANRKPSYNKFTFLINEIKTKPGDTIIVDKSTKTVALRAETDLKDITDSLKINNQEVANNSLKLKSENISKYIMKYKTEEIVFYIQKINKETEIPYIKHNNKLFNTNDIININNYGQDYFEFKIINFNGENLEDDISTLSFNTEDNLIKLTNDYFQNDTSFLNFSYKAKSYSIGLVKNIKANPFNFDKTNKDVIQIGPLTIKLNSKKNKTRHGDFIINEVNSCSFSLKVENETFNNLMFNFENFFLKYKVPKSNKDSVISAELKLINPKDKLQTNIGFLKCIADSVEIYYSENKINGELLLKTKLNKDFKLCEYAKLKKGLKGKIKCSFKQDKDKLSSSFDFSKIKNLSAAIIIKNKEIATANDIKIEPNGLSTGNFKLNPENTYKLKFAEVHLKKFDTDFKLNIRTKKISLANSNFVIQFKQIKGLNGNMQFNVLSCENGYTGEIDAENTNFRISGLSCNNLNLKLNIDSSFKFKKIDGSLTLKHNKVKSNIKIDKFVIANNGIEEIKLGSDINYNGFVFNIKNFNYSQSNGFLMSGSITMAEQEIGIERLKIDTSGNFSCSKINARIKNGCLNAGFNVNLKDNGFVGNFNAELMKYGFKGRVTIGSAENKGRSKYYKKVPYYNYGYFNISTNTALPSFVPGIKISKLGGQFGYNCGLNYKVRPPKLYPQYTRYIAGLSIGASDISGSVEILVDPAVFQFNDKEAEVNITGKINIPKRKTVFTGLLNVNYLYPANELWGYIETEINVPYNNGFVLNTPSKNRIAFESKEGIFKINSDTLCAEMFNEALFTGSLDYIRKVNDKGIVIERNANIDGKLSFNINESFSFNKDSEILGCKGNVNISFLSYLNTEFTEDSFSGNFGYDLKANANASLVLVGNTVYGEASIYANGNLFMDNYGFELNNKLDISLKCYTEENKDEGFIYNFSHDVKIDMKNK